MAELIVSEFYCIRCELFKTFVSSGDQGARRLQEWQLMACLELPQSVAEAVGAVNLHC